MAIRYSEVVQAYFGADREWRRRADAAIGFATQFMTDLARDMEMPAGRISFLEEDGKPSDLSTAMWFENGWWRWRWQIRFTEQGQGFIIKGVFSITNERGQWDFSAEKEPTVEQYDVDVGDATARSQVIRAISEALLNDAEWAANPRPIPLQDWDDRPHIGFHVSRE